MRIHRQMYLGPNLFNALTTTPLLRPRSRRPRFRSLGIEVYVDGREVLEETNEHEGHFIVRELGIIKRNVRLENENNVNGFTCWPRHSRGPALKGRNIKGFRTR